jgi:opacity protein-like surface antigen
MLLLVCAGLAATVPAFAQVSLELRAGGAVGNASPAVSGLGSEPGLALGVGAEVHAVGPVSVYAGYSRAGFGCERGFCAGQDVTFTSHGMAAGVRLHPGSVPWIRAGVLYHGLDTRSPAGSESGGAALGYEAGAGLTFALGRRLQVLPGVTYRRHDATSGDVDGHAALLSGEIGFRYRLR